MLPTLQGASCRSHPNHVRNHSMIPRAFYSESAGASCAEWNIARCWLCVVIGLLAHVSVGCRSLANRNANSQLVAARQLSLRGADALQRSRSQDAELLFAEALQNSPLDERAHWGYATSLWKRNERERAVKHMKEALRLSGRNPDYAIRLGEMQLDMGDRNAARESALSVLSANRGQPDAWALLGDTHHSERDWPAALECYHQALLIRSDFPRVQLSVAEIYRYLDRPKRSLAVLDRMNDLHATAAGDPECLLSRGLALSDLGQRQEAADVLAKASERMPVDKVDKCIQIVQAQQKIDELVAARISLGRLMGTNTNINSNPELARLQQTLDSSFETMADSRKRGKELQHPSRPYEPDQPSERTASRQQNGRATQDPGVAPLRTYR